MTCTRSAAGAPGRGLNCLQTGARCHPTAVQRSALLAPLLAPLALALGVGLGLGAGCSEQARLSVDGPTPYARCLGRASGEAGAGRVGGLALSIEQGVLSIAGLPRLPRLAVFAGPGPGPAPSASAIAALAAAKPSLVLVLGELGDAPALAGATASALDRLGMPVLVVGGGRDSLATLGAADALPNVVDVSPLRAVRLVPGKAAGPASYSLVPVAGALDGRYARTKDGCGYTADDLDDDREPPEAEPGERRVLVAWQASTDPRPARLGDAGSAPLAAFGQAVGASAGLFAWPHAQAGHPRSTRDGSPRPPGIPADDLSLVVPRLSGPALERADGSRLPPGFAVVELSPEGPVLRELAQLAAP